MDSKYLPGFTGTQTSAFKLVKNLKDRIQKGLHIQGILSNTHLIYPTIKEETDCGLIGH